MLTQDQINSIRWKFQRYTKEQCLGALRDIRETEFLLGGHNHPDKDYLAKLEAERDSATLRLTQLRGKRTCPCCNGKGSIPENEG